VGGDALGEARQRIGVIGRRGAAEERVAQLTRLDMPRILLRVDDEHPLARVTRPLRSQERSRQLELTRTPARIRHRVEGEERLRPGNTVSQSTRDALKVLNLPLVEEHAESPRDERLAQGLRQLRVGARIAEKNVVHPALRHHGPLFRCDLSVHSGTAEPGLSRGGIKRPWERRSNQLMRSV
jgi:hypothetical protein